MNRSASIFSKAMSRSAAPGSISGEKTFGPKRRWVVTAPPRWAIPCTSLFFTS